MSILFQPLTVGALELPNRLVMAPLTRSRAGESRIPNDLMQEYYVQRASAGLIITEATAITPSAVGYADTPGIWSEEQVAGWKKITDAVRAAGGRMVMQLWHVGRISDPIFLNGELPVAPTAIKPAGHVSLVRPKKEYVTPRALTTAEVKQIVQDYRQAAINAKAAGFDGVELHGANGYLIDQFLQTKTNQRDDEYGGAVENRARLLLEVTDQLIDVWGADRVGVHLAPRRDSHDMGDDDPVETFGYVADQLGQRKIAFICAREYVADDSLAGLIKQKFGGVFIANEKLEREQAERLLELGEADAVAFGQLYIANPDLVERFKQQAELNAPNPATYYAEGATGYTDYPFLNQ
ncbi:alkene reductase [Alkanindiges illinoisensis]|uniref:Alkene reductase n=1 Tax=Alkanindiges illinoisensis TaxID=197183 RepID=A0A4Y7XC01_9GAMM|nr:alkene reductase [Alkanindiges illinoisensis]TEU26839.1 alkene reductase [Alkanindiges illinoisensis]